MPSEWLPRIIIFNPTTWQDFYWIAKDTDILAVALTY